MSPIKWVYWAMSAQPGSSEAAIVWDFACENGLIANADELKALNKFNWGSLWVQVPFTDDSFVCLDDTLAGNRRMYVTFNDFTWAIR